MTKYRRGGAKRVARSSLYVTSAKSLRADDPPPATLGNLLRCCGKKTDRGLEWGLQMCFTDGEGGIGPFGLVRENACIMGTLIRTFRWLALATSEKFTQAEERRNEQRAVRSEESCERYTGSPR